MCEQSLIRVDFKTTRRCFVTTIELNASKIKELTVLGSASQTVAFFKRLLVLKRFSNAFSLINKKSGLRNLFVKYHLFQIPHI